MATSRLTADYIRGTFGFPFAGLPTSRPFAAVRSTIHSIHSDLLRTGQLLCRTSKFLYSCSLRRLLPLCSPFLALLWRNSTPIYTRSISRSAVHRCLLTTRNSTALDPLSCCLVHVEFLETVSRPRLCLVCCLPLTVHLQARNAKCAR